MVLDERFYGLVLKKVVAGRQQNELVEKVEVLEYARDIEVPDLQLGLLLHANL